MSYNILHVFPSDVYTGTVAHVLQVSKGLELHGHNIFLATDKPNISDRYPSFQLPVTNRSFSQRFNNIKILVQLIQAHHIDIIHSHSRAASWISYYAAAWSRLPQVATIHGRQHKHKPFLRKVDVYGSFIISICPNLIVHLENEIGLSPHKIRFIPNGIDFAKLPSSSGSRLIAPEFVISVISRFNGMKGRNISQLLINVFPFLLKQNSTIKINLVGGEWEKFPMEGKNKFNELKSEFGNRIDYLGFCKEVLTIMADSDLIIGSGRVAIESTLLNVPVLVLGETCYHGILCKENIKEAIDSNFGDILPHQSTFLLNNEVIRKDLEAFLSGNNEKGLNLSYYLEQYNLDLVVSEIINVYQKAIALKKQPKYPSFIRP